MLFNRYKAHQRRLTTWPKRSNQTRQGMPYDPNGDFDDMGQTGRAAGYHYGQKVKRGSF